MKDASGPETKTDTQTPPLVVNPVAGPFTNRTRMDRGWDTPISITIEDVSVVESPRYKFVPADSPPKPAPAPDDGSKAFVDEVYKGIPSVSLDGHFEATGEITTTTSKRTTTWTVSPFRFTTDEVLDDSHRMPMVASSKPCGCQDKEGGGDFIGNLLSGLAAMAPSVFSMFGGKGGSVPHAAPSGPTYWQMYCAEKGIDPQDTSMPTDEQAKDFEQWMKDRVVGKSDPDPSTEH